MFDSRIIQPLIIGVTISLLMLVTIGPLMLDRRIMEPLLLGVFWPLLMLVTIVNYIFIQRKKRREAEASVAQPTEDQNKQPDD